MSCQSRFLILSTLILFIANPPVLYGQLANRTYRYTNGNPLGNESNISLRFSSDPGDMAGNEISAVLTAQRVKNVVGNTINTDIRNANVVLVQLVDAETDNNFKRRAFRSKVPVPGQNEGAQYNVVIIFRDFAVSQDNKEQISISITPTSTYCKILRDRAKGSEDSSRRSICDPDTELLASST